MLPPTRGSSLTTNKKNLTASNNAKHGTSDATKESGPKKSFQFQIPQVMASLTAKVAHRAPLTLPRVLPKIDINKSFAPKSSNVKYGQHPDPTKYNADLLKNAPLPETYYDYNIPETKPRLPGKQKSNTARKNNAPLPPNNRAAKYLAEDEKDFEIPLEESLKAVEDFIEREKGLTQWKVGETVLAKWKGNGLYYKAEILDIFTQGSVLVIFDTYDETDEVNYRDLSKYYKKTNAFKKKGKKEVVEQSKEDKKNKI